MHVLGSSSFAWQCACGHTSMHTTRAFHGRGTQYVHLPLPPTLTTQNSSYCWLSPLPTLPGAQPPGDSICLVQYGLIKVSVPFDGGKPGAASSGPASAKPAVADSKAGSDKGGHKRNMSSSSSKSSKGGGSNSSSSGANKKGSKQSKSKSKATQGKAPANCWLHQPCNKSPCGCSPN